MEDQDKKLIEYLKKKTDEYSKKILFHQILTIFYVILFFYFLNMDDFFIPRYITLPIFLLIGTFHFLLFRKYQWMYDTFGYTQSDEEHEEE
jgi:uncharacterized membrane protein HdeD (DUF308 family)